MDDPEFRRDLYQGTPSYHDRLGGVPDSLIDDSRSRPTDRAISWFLRPVPAPTAAPIRGPEASLMPGPQSCLSLLRKPEGLIG